MSTTINLTGGFVERALAYAALSYGFGFVVVMLHTARLGFPVIGLLEPIYVLIGLPLAAVAFFGNQLNTFIRQRAAEARDSLKVFAHSFGNDSKPVAQPTKAYIEQLATFFA